MRKSRKAKRKEKKDFKKALITMEEVNISQIKSKPQQVESVMILSTKQYMKMQSDIQDLTATIEALEGVIEEQRANNRRLQGRLEEVTDKYRALMESYHQVQGW